ncbi:hypothetical protein [Aquimarina longa]|uniref:hypothetical protein n=1 Tax=Aquimarina longa TaxID=1080221 RepID=UPI0011DF2764|nr:hypothetical protein [Aquimarina longa]
MDSSIYEKYTGRYTLIDSPKDTIRVIYRNNKLHLIFQNENLISLSSDAKTKFYVDIAPWTGV